VGCGPPHSIEEFVDEQGCLIPGKSAGTVLDFRIRNSDLHMSMANGIDRQKRMDVFSGRIIQSIGQKQAHPANEYLQDEKGQYLSAVTSPCGVFLSFLP
jgi:hypothetical protein